MGLLLHSDTLPLDHLLLPRFLGSRPQGLLLFLPLILSLGLHPLSRPLRLRDSNAPGPVCLAEALRLLRSCRRWLGSRSQDLLLLFLALPFGFLSRPKGFLGSRPQGNPTGIQEVQAAKTLSLGILPLAQPLRLLGSNAPGLFFHAETLRLLRSCPQSLLLLARPLRLLASLALRLLHSRPQARTQGLVFLSLGLMSCHATGLLLLAETLSLGLLR